MPELIIERDYDVTELDVVRGDGWTLYGRIVPFGGRQEVRDGDGATYLERFARGSFDRDVEKGGRWVNLRVGHHGPDHDAYLGRCLGLESLPSGLYGTFRLDRDHPLADAARSGEFRKWSVGTKVFTSRKVSDPDGASVIERVTCAINHVAATTSPQYAGAGVLVARDHQMLGVPAAPARDALLARFPGARRATVHR